MFWRYGGGDNGDAEPTVAVWVFSGCDFSDRMLTAPSVREKDHLYDLSCG